MSIYAIGDVQGCFDELQQLLDRIQFNPSSDILWFTGDLINRGKQSLDCIRFIKALGKSAVTVLGNHDLHFLAVAGKATPYNKTDTFLDILDAPDVKILTEWLRYRPLMHYDNTHDFVMVHAGIAPHWTFNDACSYAKEVETVLRSNNYHQFLANMYGDMPDTFHASLKGFERLRVITNYFTRMRYVNANGQLELRYKGPPGKQPAGYYPWFLLPGRKPQERRIIFGHWASLNGDTQPNTRVFALDTGCCWGNCLTALRLEDLAYFTVQCDNAHVK